MIYKRKDRSDSFTRELSLTPSISARRQFILDNGTTIDNIKSWLCKIQWKILLGTFMIWLLLVQYMERNYVKNVIQRCHWDQWEQWNDNSDDNKPHRIALVADPQIIDDYSYQGRPAMFNYFVKKITDNYLHRNHMYMQEYIDPDNVIFLGDLFDGGRQWDNDYWFDEYQRYNRIFPKKVNRLTISSIPGNHDIGFDTMDIKTVNRFALFNGELNDVIELGNHTFILLDTISLSSLDPKISKEPREFLDNINTKIMNPSLPKILLMHVPFYRFNDRQLCGPLRESKQKFPIQKGVQYQTVISHELTKEVLTKIGPSIAFAGDDHDYCDIQQPYMYKNQPKVAREITVKSVAMSSGIKYPAIQLLSLNNPTDQLNEKNQETYQTKMCYMPHPYISIRLYVLLYFIILGGLIIEYIVPNKKNQIISLLHRESNQSPTLNLPTFDEEKVKSYRKSEPLSTEVADIPMFTIHLTIVTIIPIFILNFYYKNI